MSDTCRLSPPFGDPWPSCLLPSQLVIFLPAILIPACASSSPAFLMMYSAYKLNKHHNNIQPWRTPFPFWTSLLFHVQFQLLLPDLHTSFSRARSGGLVFPSLSELWLKQQYKDLSGVRPRNCVSSHWATPDHWAQIHESVPQGGMRFFFIQT